MCIDNIILQLSRKGYKLTPQRKLLLDILFQQEGHMSAEELFEEIKVSQPNVSFGTVYRNLSILVEIGIVNQLDFKDGRSRFEVCLDHHHHLVCLDCGRAIDMPMCPFTKVIDEAADANKFSIKNHNFEVFGYCEGCTRNRSRNKQETEEPRKGKQGGTV